VSDYKIVVTFSGPQGLVERDFVQDYGYVAQRDAESVADKLVRFHGAERAAVWSTRYDHEKQERVTDKLLYCVNE